MIESFIILVSPNTNVPRDDDVLFALALLGNRPDSSGHHHQKRIVCVTSRRGPYGFATELRNSATNSGGKLIRTVRRNGRQQAKLRGRRTTTPRGHYNITPRSALGNQHRNMLHVRFECMYVCYSYCE